MTTGRLNLFKSACAAMILFAACLSADAQQSRRDLEWPRITNQTKPWTRWWWLGSILDKKDLTIEMEKYRKAGLGGLEITPIYGVKGYEDRFIEFLSPRWMEMLSHTLSEAERLDLGIDLATGTGWPFGGRWIGDEDACKNFVYKTYALKSGERLSETIAFAQKPLVRAIGRKVNIAEIKDPIGANMNLQELALDQVRFEKPLSLEILMGFSDKGEKLDLTGKVNSDGKLDWIAGEGNWSIYAIFQGWHGKMVERAGPGGEGNVIDHFSDRALGNYLRKFDLAFEGRRVGSIRAFFNDSYEVDDADGDANWTPGFLEEFRKRRGYDLRYYLPALLGKDDAEKNSRVLSDYRETVSDLLLEKFTIPWRRWATARGSIIRNQSHGSPANLLDLYAASDIPETEGLDILRMKFASSAAHVTGKPLASAEAATWLGEHFQSTLGDVKEAADRYFLGGVNHICYHGTPYSPQSVEWPGWMFYAAVHFGPTNSFWSDFPALNSYITRCQSFLQAGRPDNDFLLYYPVYDSWAQPGRSLLQHYGGGFDSAMNQADAQAMIDAGYSFDLCSDRQLTEVKFNGNELQTGGLSYRAIVLPSVKFMPLKTFEKIVELAGQGATIIVRDGLPGDVSGFPDLESRRKIFQTLKARIRFEKNERSGIETAKLGRGAVFAGKDLKQLLEASGFKRESMVDSGLQYVRRGYENGRYYFIVNQGKNSFDGWVQLQSSARAVAIFDPMHEERGFASIRSGNRGGTEVYLQLDAGESVILKTFRASAVGRRFEYFKAAGEPRRIAGTWAVDFVQGGPELPAPVKIDSLKSWTEFGGDAVKKFSGTARYAISFKRPSGSAAAWLLDLGRADSSARVLINGEEIGTLIKSPYRLKIPGDLLKAENTLEIYVSNLMANRIADMDRRKVVWKKFYNINFPPRRPENRGPDGLFSAAGWRPHESGLIGPVTITPYR